MSQKKCPSCGAWNNGNAEKCNSCGELMDRKKAFIIKKKKVSLLKKLSLDLYSK